MSPLSRPTLAILIGLGLFVMLAAIGWSTVDTLDRAGRMRQQAQTALLTSANLLSALVDVETGQRGYIISGDPEYLEPHEAGLRAYPVHLRALHAQTAAFEGMPAMLDGLDELIERRVALSRRYVAIRRIYGVGPSREAIARKEGKRLADELRRRIARIEARLTREIAGWDARRDAVLRRSRWMASGLVLLATVLILASLVGMGREHAYRRRAEGELQDVNAQLEARVTARTSELELARRQLQTFARRLDRQVESERRRLAREVHDQLGQVFTALKLTLTHTATAHPQAKEPLAQAITLLDEGVVTARRIASELRPPLLDDLGLGAAIDHRGQRFQEETGVACETDVHEADGLSAEQSLQLFRIVQESLTNVARHAHATRVRIEGRVDDGVYRLSVEDDGRGMVEPRPSSLGMLSILERTLLSGGALVVDSAPGRGTRIEVSLPVQAQGETA